MHSQAQRKNTKTIPLPTSDVTLYALDVLLKNTGKRFNGRELQNQVEAKLGRHVNYSGLLKQLRVYATKPGWNLVLNVDEQSHLANQVKNPSGSPRPTLEIYAQDNIVSHNLRALIQKLNDTREAMGELAALKVEWEAEQKRIFSDPYCDMKEARARRLETEKKLDRIASRIYGYPEAYGRDKKND